MLDVHFSLFLLNIYVAHSVKVWEVSILYFLFYNVFVNFPCLPLGLSLIKVRLFAFHQHVGVYSSPALKYCFNTLFPLFCINLICKARF